MELQVKHDDAVSGLDYVSRMIWRLSEHGENRPVTIKEAEQISVYLQQATNTLNAWYVKLKKPENLIPKGNATSLPRFTHLVD